MGALKVYTGDCVASISLGASEWNTIISGNGFFDTQPYKSLFSAAFKDSFDFIFFVLDSNGAPPNFQYSGVYMSANSRVPVRTGRLLGTMVLPNILSPQGFLNPIKGGPVLHEIAHEWANLGLIPSPADPAHWGFSSSGGQLGGFQNETLRQLSANQWQASGPATSCVPSLTPASAFPFMCTPAANPGRFGTFANGGNSVSYSGLELFSMGLIRSDLVPDTRVASGGTWVDPSQGIFSVTSWQTISAASILASNPNRIAPNGSGQKHFKIATVVLTPKPSLDAPTLAELNQTLTGFSADGVPPYGMANGSIFVHNFYTATKGLATMRAGELLREVR